MSDMSSKGSPKNTSVAFSKDDELHEKLFEMVEVNVFDEAVQKELYAIDPFKLISFIKQYSIQDKRKLLLRLKQHGHGGGNWRRLVENELAKLDEGER